jgi:hypothetical protein
MPQQVAVAAREKGIPIDDGIARTNLKQILAVYGEKHPLDKITAAQTHAVFARQMPDGSWPEATSRPPMEYSSISRTAMSIRTLTAYPIEGRRTELDERLRRSRVWMLAQRPQSTEEHAMRLMALAWTRAPQAKLHDAARELIALQRPNGGWAQLPHFQPDAYGTGISLVALHEVDIEVSHAAYQNGIHSLCSLSRRVAIRSYITSGFPRPAPVGPRSRLRIHCHREYADGRVLNRLRVVNLR